MNGEFLYEAMGGIGPDLIAEGRYLSLGKTAFRKLLELAACLALCLGLGLAATLLLPQAGFAPALSQPVEETAMQESFGWVLLYAVAMSLTFAAWVLPAYSWIRKREEKWTYVCSALCCTLSLLLQLSGLLILLRAHEWNIIKDYVNFFLFFAAATIALTVILNGCLWLHRAKKWSWPLFINGLFLALCLLSAIQYGFLVGRHKSWVALGGLVELFAVAVTIVLYLIRLITGKAKQTLYWSNMILLFMQIIPFLFSIVISWFFCTWYHGICMLVGIRLWRFHQKEG